LENLVECQLDWSLWHTLWNVKACQMDWSSATVVTVLDHLSACTAISH